MYTPDTGQDANKEVMASCTRYQFLLPPPLVFAFRTHTLPTLVNHNTKKKIGVHY